MPADWPHWLAEEDYEFAASAWNWGVTRDDLLEVLSLPRKALVTIEYGSVHVEHDTRYKSRSAFAIGPTYRGELVAVVLRLDNREHAIAGCLVFHAHYL